MWCLRASLAIAVALMAVIAWQPGDAARDEVAAPRSVVAAVTLSSPVVTADHTHDWAATVLARPLFSPNRRPAADATTIAGTGPSKPPRLTGIVVGPFGRSAIFAGDGGKSIVVNEGGRINAFTVKSIETAQVYLLRPEGTDVLQPTFAAGSGPGGSTAAPEPLRRGTCQRLCYIRGRELGLAHGLGVAALCPCR
jgi:hypothetical protein